MAEPLDPIRPKPSMPAYLPRLWKSPPEPEEVVEPAPSRSKKKRSKKEEPELSSKSEKTQAKKKKKKTEEVIDDGTGASKLEETPVLDTYEARQRARWIIGGLISAIGLIALVIVLQAFRGNGEEIRDGEPPDPRIVSSEPRPNVELEARKMLETAKRADKLGKTQVAIDHLNKLTKTYQGTAAAREALHAIDRNRHNRPLFGSDAPELATGPKATAPGLPLATGPVPPKSGGSADATANPPKPSDHSSNREIATAPVAPAAPAIPSKPLPSGFRAKPDAPIHSSGWPARIICERDGAEMVLVPGGTFNMGREDGDPTERPAHQVTLSTYYIDLHEVTVRQYLQFLKDTGRPFDSEKMAPDEFPVVNISAREAKAFCLWAGRRLPTEAQWEMAARAPNGRISFWNGEIPRKDPPKGPRLMEPVMSLPSDVAACGAFDMGANAWEWTSEYFDSQHYQQFRKPVTDPTGPKESRSKLVQVTVKGGSRAGILTWREGQKIESRLPYLGFRGALPVEGAPSLPAPATSPSSKPTLPGGVQPF